MNENRIIRTSAPVRLDFAGGWTDVAPFATEEGGVVVNAAVELRAHVELELGGNCYQLHSEDFGSPREASDTLWALDAGSAPDLRKAALRRAALGPCALRTRADVPPGSGLGGSGALGVALVAALNAARDISHQPALVADEAFLLEAVDAALPGGKQDQYAAALGGFHCFRFAKEQVDVERLRLDPSFAEALAEQIVICYTGTSRVSSDTISRVMGAYAHGDAKVVRALRSMVEIAHDMADALLRSDLGGVARLLSRNWEAQQQLDPGMQTVEMATLEAAMRYAGALGGKAAGAGAGGSMFFVVRDKAAAIRAAQASGAQVIPFTWSATGVTEERD